MQPLMISRDDHQILLGWICPSNLRPSALLKSLLQIKAQSARSQKEYLQLGEGG